MSGWRSSDVSRAAALAGVALLSACTRELAVQPFHIQALDGPSGASVIPASASGATLLAFAGTAHPSGASLTVDTSDGPRIFSFDNAADRTVVFPASLEGAFATVELVASPGTSGARGEADPIVGLRVASPEGHFRFLIGESHAVSDKGLALVPRPLGPESPTDDLPSFETLSDDVYFEPARCGELYFDQLHATDASGELLLRSGQRGTLPGSAADPTPWTILHVLSWHRGGGDPSPDSPCASEIRGWVQFAAWR